MSVQSIFSRCARRSVAKPAISAAVFRAHQRRSIHLPPSTSVDKYAETGIEGLFSPKAFNTNWTTYQSMLVDNMNRLTSGNAELEDKPALDVAIMTSRQADQAAIFNYASQAYNNHFFFQALTTEKTHLTESLLHYIPYTFASPAAMKTEMLATANAMFGNGWVWLVIDSNRYLRILCTYNAGTPFGGSHRRQEVDMNTHLRIGSAVQEMTDAAKSAAQKGPINSWATPLLALKVWEHAWVEDFGVDGKEKYLEALWEKINWDVVSSRAPFTASQQEWRANLGGAR